MARQVINIGSGPNKNDGDPLRLAFEKINSNFNELYNSSTLDGVFVGDVTGSVFADDSSVLVDATNSTLYGTLYGDVTGDVTGSVFADDSSVLVDAVNGTIPGYVRLDELKTAFDQATDFADLKARVAGL